MAQLDAIDGVNAVDGTALTAYGAGLAGSYALATNLIATGTAYTQPLIGTNSSGDAATEFSGRLDGLGHTITGLTINAPSTDYDALLGFVSGANATVSNIGLVGGSVTGRNNIGSLVGWLDVGAVVQTSFSGAAVTGTGVNNTGGLIGFNTGTVQSSYATGPVTGIFGTGGLVGWAVTASTITNSYATGVISGANYTGGLIGLNNGNVSFSYATGSVTGTTLDAGGLIGIHQGGTVNASYATGAVTGVTNTGGLIGASTATVQTSYATGAVKGTGVRTGGLIGQNTGILQTSYATGAVTGTTAVGGLVAANGSTGNVSFSYATGAVVGTGTNVGGLIGGNNGGVVSASYATGTVTGTGATVGGFIGANTGTVATSYWDIQTSGWTISAGGSGVAGLTTAQLQGALPTGFNATVWLTGTGLYPYLNWQFAAGTTPQSLSGIAYQANSTALARATIAGTVNGSAFAGSTGADGYYYLLLPQGSTAQGSGVLIDLAGNAVKANDYVQGAVGSVQNLNLNAGMLNVVTAATRLSSVASGLASAVGGMSATNLVFSMPGGVLTPNAGTSVSIAAAGAFSVDQALVVPNALLLDAAGSLTIAATGSLSSSSGNATLVGSTFVNNAGAGAVSAPNGRWLIYSGDPLNDTLGGLAYNFKQYGATYGVTAVAQATGNGVLYTVSPTVGLTGTFSKTYDGNTSAPGSYSIGFTGYDQDVLTLTYANAVYGDANAGTGKTVIAGGVAITAATNGGATVYGYTTTTASGNIGSITARPITVTADAQSRVYGNANPTLTYAIGGSGLVNNDSLSGGLITNAATASGVGSYGIAQGSLAASSNYALTYTGANLAVTARPITVTADGQSRVYGDANPALTYAVGGSGLVNNNSLSGGLTTSATTATGVGSYGIAQGSLTGGVNYALTYTGANLAVTARAITVTADAQSRVYGDANPALTYAVGGSGLVNNDSLSGSLTTSATTASGVGSYGIAQGSLTGGVNYALTYTGANLAVTARAITVTADGQSRVYGDANPALTYAVGGSGLVNNDSLSGSLTTGATTASGVGSYGITQGSLAGGGNYALTYTGANLAVTARPIAVTADAQSRVFGDANPVLTYSVGAQGLVNGDTLAGSLATAATPTAVAGTYAITEGTLISALNPNYAITYAGANLVVVAVAPPPSTPAEGPITATSPFIVAAADATPTKPASISLQLDQSTPAGIAPLPVTSGRVVSGSGPATQTATRPDSDDDIVTGSIAAHDFKSADGFVYKPLSQYDAAQYSGNELPGYESQAGDAAILTMLLRGALGSSDAPKIDNLFDPGKGLQWSGVNWENPLARKISFSDGGGHTDAPGESFPIRSGATDLAALLGKGPVILTGSSNTANAAPFSLLGVAMTKQGIVANDPSTGLQVLIDYNSETETLGSIVSVFDSKTRTWTMLADLKPNNDGRTQPRFDQLAKWSVDRFVAVSVPH